MDMHDIDFQIAFQIVSSTGCALQAAQIVRLLRPSRGIDRVVMRLMGVRSEELLERIYCDGMTLNQIADTEFLVNEAASDAIR